MNTADLIAKDVKDSAFKIHTKLGPGLPESAYEACLAHELAKRGYEFDRQKPQAVIHDPREIDVGYRIDIRVNGEVILEPNAGQVLPIHHPQLVTNLKLTGKTLGPLINFNVPLVKRGTKRLAIHHPEP